MHVRSQRHAAQPIVRFCRFARQQGLSGGVQKTLGALRAMACLGMASREDLKSGLRSVLCSSKDEWDRFEEVFEAFWSGDGTWPRVVKEPPRQEKCSKDSDARDQRRVSLMAGVPASDASQGAGAEEVSGASVRSRLRKADFSTLRQDDLAVLERISQRLTEQMGRRISRRRQLAHVPEIVDLRRTIRGSISRGGDPIDLRYRHRRVRPPSLVILLDISGSMSPYSVFLVRFVYALQKHFPRVDAFLFSTELVEITDVLRARRLSDALRALSHLALGWSGGTKIGGCLQDFDRFYRRRLRSADTFFMILSDGWDTGDPEALAAALGAIKRRVKKVIWLNPLLGLADYQPITAGMSAALLHIDVFAPAHNLESLLQLEKHL